MDKITLPHKVGITIPKNSNDGIPFGKGIVQSVVTEFAKEFGGATYHDASGAWINDEGELILEPVTIIYSNHDKDADYAILFIENLASELKIELKQEAIAFEIDNVLYLN